MLSDIEKNNQILVERMNLYDSISGPRVGDWIKEKDGRMSRITHDWNSDGETSEIIQHGGSEFGSFYLGAGYLEYSGSLDTGIRKNQLKNTGKVKSGKVWFFNMNYATAGNGINYTVNFRVYEVT